MIEQHLILLQCDKLKGIAEAIEQPIPIIMNLISADQEIVVNVVAESDQPHAK